MARGDGGIGKADPWPTNDQPIWNETNEASPHYQDGFYNRAPLGGHNELPSQYWLDCLVYPERPDPINGNPTSEADFRGRMFALNAGNVTGKKPGPSTDW